MSERRAVYATQPQPTPATLIDLQVSEEGFQRSVIELACLLGWRVYHTHDSRRSDCGWPDLALLKPPRFILAELKSQRGRLRPEQREWLALLEQCPMLEAYLFRPSDWPRIVEILSNEPPALSPTLADGARRAESA